MLLSRLKQSFNACFFNVYQQSLCFEHKLKNVIKIRVIFLFLENSLYTVWACFQNADTTSRFLLMSDFLLFDHYHNFMESVKNDAVLNVGSTLFIQT